LCTSSARLLASGVFGPWTISPVASSSGRRSAALRVAGARAKTDRLDARTLAKLLMTGLLEPVWTPDERTRALRRLTNRRERIVRSRTRAKNEAHGVLSRTLCERPPVTDAFSKGRPPVAGGPGAAH
jgi:hypothetical protein